MVVYDIDNNASILKRNDSLTLEQMMIDFDNEKNDLIKWLIYIALRKTRMTISRFRMWKTKRDIEIVLYPMKSPRGQLLYHNIRCNRQAWEEVELRLAKRYLRLTKESYRIQDELERIENKRNN